MESKLQSLAAFEAMQQDTMMKTVGGVGGSGGSCTEYWGDTEGGGCASGHDERLFTQCGKDIVNDGPKYCC